jgi:predicted glycosyltransferase
VTCRVMFYVQHLLGIGHVRRASLIARGMAQAGLDVSVALGGREVPGIDFNGCTRVLLPSVHAADESFKTLLDESGKRIDDEWRDHRAARLIYEYEALRPRVLMLELFPFGRRMFGFELLPLLTAARASSASSCIVCSLRDILVRKRDAAFNRRTVAFARTWIDRILIHGDPKLVPIEASFPEMAEIADKLSYTGYVVEMSGPIVSELQSPIGNGEVIVSVGGGAVGLSLLRAAIGAKPLSRLANATWRLITGPNLPDDAFAALAWSPPPGIIVERWRSDLPALFRSCAVSVSQAGYNTVMDLLRARARAVLVPFAAGGESEQTVRAEALAARGLAVSIEAATLSPKILADAIDKALTLAPHCVEIDCTGVETTARLVSEMCKAVETG